MSHSSPEIFEESEEERDENEEPEAGESDEMEESEEENDEVEEPEAENNENEDPWQAQIRNMPRELFERLAVGDPDDGRFPPEEFEEDYPLVAFEEDRGRPASLPADWPLIEIHELNTTKVRWSQQMTQNANRFTMQVELGINPDNWVAVRTPENGSNEWGIKYNYMSSPDKWINAVRDDRREDFPTHIRHYFAIIAHTGTQLTERFDLAYDVHQIDQTKCNLTTIVMPEYTSERRFVGKLIGIQTTEIRKVLAVLEGWYDRLESMTREQCEQSVGEARADAEWIKHKIWLDFEIDEDQVRQRSPSPFFCLLSSAHMYLAMSEVSLYSHCREHLMGDNRLAVRVRQGPESTDWRQMSGHLYFHPVKLSVARPRHRETEIHGEARYPTCAWVWSTKLPEAYDTPIAISAQPELLDEIWCRRKVVNGALFLRRDWDLAYAFYSSLGCIRRTESATVWDQVLEADEFLCKATHGLLFHRDGAFPPWDHVNRRWPFTLFIQ